MSESPTDPRAAKLEDALAESQRLERAERAADMDRQRRADERVIEALAKSENGHSSSG